MTSRSIPATPLFLYPNVAPRPIGSIGSATIDIEDHSSTPYSPEFNRPEANEFFGLLEEMLAQLEQMDSESPRH